MRRSIADLLNLLHRWPRRLAALACLVLAGGSTVASRGSASAQATASTSAVVVSARALPVGTTLGADDVDVAHWPIPVAPHNRVADPAGVIGRRLAAPVGAGEAITPTRLLGADLAAGLVRGLVATSVTVDDDVGAFVHPGDRVDLLAGSIELSGAATETPAAAEFVAHDVVVLAVLPPARSAGDPDRTQLVIAADRATALRVAAAHGRALLAVVGNPP